MKQDDQHVFFLFLFSNCTKFTVIKMQTSEATQTERNCGGQRVSGVFEFSLKTTVDIFVHLPAEGKTKGLSGLILLNTGFLNPVPLFSCKNITRFFKV